MTVKLQRFLGVYFFKKKKNIIVVHSFVLQAFVKHLLVPGTTVMFQREAMNRKPGF